MTRTKAPARTGGQWGGLKAKIFVDNLYRRDVQFCGGCMIIFFCVGRGMPKKLKGLLEKPSQPEMSLA